MTTLQAFFLGIMAAWTPSLIILAWFVRHAPSEKRPERVTSRS